MRSVQLKFKTKLLNWDFKDLNVSANTQYNYAKKNKTVGGDLFRTLNKIQNNKI